MRSFGEENVEDNAEVMDLEKMNDLLGATEVLLLLNPQLGVGEYDSASIVIHGDDDSNTEDDIPPTILFDQTKILKQKR